MFIRIKIDLTTLLLLVKIFIICILKNYALHICKYKM